MLLTIALALACLLALVLSALQLPGTWLLVAAAAGYDWCFGWQRFGVRGLALLAGMAVVAELFELLPSLWLARRVGASRRAAWTGLLGGVAGMFVFTLPAPVVGTIAGGVIGCFLGALAGELTVRDEMGGALRVGAASAVGRVIGLAGKLAAAMGMAGAAMAMAIYHR